MATKKDLVADIRRQYGNMLCIKDVASYFGISRNAAADLLHDQDVDYYPLGKKKLYLAMDVAKVMEAIKNT